MTYHLILFSLIFLTAGVAHFLQPRQFLRIMPPYLPWPRFLVLLSGALEILLAIALWWPAWRSLAAWGLIFLLVAVFPANVEMLRSKRAALGLPRWLLILRLPLQLLLILWALQYNA